ncbi:MAG: quinohemoprotein amine dehydrogenase subunit alpha [Acidobacteria bacterium]|nr:quinohemoprotein amine dehydrogenase subunit alpha [Acidobacteriota bacterium]
MRILAPLVAAAGLFAQAPPAAPAKPEAAKPEPSEPGIPVTNELVIRKCSGCHAKDEKGNLTRISWERTTPEGWQQVIKRMVRLNGVTLTPDEARHVVRALSASHGLAPEEAKPAVYFHEKRHVDEEVPDVARDACISCHAWGQPMNWRRSKEEWDLLGAMHTGYFPVVEFTAFRNRPNFGAPPPAPGADSRHPVEKALEHLAKAYPLRTPEWANWQASMRTPRLAGRWLISARRPGHSRVFGELLLEPAGEGEFTSSITMHHGDGRVESRKGRGLVYTGYAWRGRSDGAADPRQLREVMMVSRDQLTMEGRWFWGGYDEFGYDVKLTRAGEALILGTSRTGLRRGTQGQEIRIHGDAFPAGLTPRDIDFGNGITVASIEEQTASAIRVRVDVAANAVNGRRDLMIRRAALAGAVAVYDTVDALKVTPATGLARLGGNTHPKGLVQFEAIGFNRGADDKPGTADDIDLGVVPVEWSMEEFLAVYGDDDKEFVGTLGPTGLFTPASEGPNPKRKFSRNNYGDVWVVGTYKGQDAAVAKDGRPVQAKSYLVVTIPLYMRWDQPEVAQ